METDGETAVVELAIARSELLLVSELLGLSTLVLGLLDHVHGFGD